MPRNILSKQFVLLDFGLIDWLILKACQPVWVNLWPKFLELRSYLKLIIFKTYLFGNLTSPTTPSQGTPGSNCNELGILLLLVKLGRMKMDSPAHWPNEYSVRQWSRRPGFTPRSSHTKNLKMVFDTSLLNTRHYKVRIKGNSGAIRGKE